MAPRRGGKNCWPFNPGTVSVLKEQFYSARLFSPCVDPYIAAPIITGSLANALSFPSVQFIPAVYTAASIYIQDNAINCIHPITPTIKMELHGYGDFAAGAGVGPMFDIGYLLRNHDEDLTAAVTWMAAATTTHIQNVNRLRITGTAEDIPATKPGIEIIIKRRSNDLYAGNYFLLGIRIYYWAGVWTI